MPTHAEKRGLSFTPRQIFDLVADVDHYHEFLPWCLAARVKSRDGQKILVETTVGYKMVRESFTTEDVMTPPDGDRPGRIDIAFKEGPFQFLTSHWIFEADGKGGCLVDFFIDFEFKSHLLQKIIGVIFNEGARLMVSAFEKRARHVYGPPVRAR